MQPILALLLAAVVVSAACRRPPEPTAAPAPVPSSEPREIRIGGGARSSPPAFYVIDGVLHRPPVDLSSIDHSDIVAVEVVRGDQAVARFGTEARTGVVVITTK